MNAIASHVEEARRRWNGGDLPGYLRLYDETIKQRGLAPEPMSKTDVTGFYQQIWSSFGDPPPLEFHEVMTDGDLYCCRFTMNGPTPRFLHGHCNDRAANSAARYHDDALLWRSCCGALVQCRFSRSHDPIGRR